MSDDPLIGQVVADRFRIESLIGEGQMARVYAAEQLSVGRRVALKLLRTELGQVAEALARFRREAMAVTRLASPHTVEVYDFGDSGDGTLFIAMELLQGGTLRARLDRDRALPLIEVVSIVRQIAASLGEAHSQGVIHRDLKPENVHFSNQPTPMRPFIKVLDFGLAKLLGADDMRITGARKTVGTPAYLAPEVAVKDGVADWRSDLYALGIMTFEMLTGTRPYDGDNPVQVMVAHLRAPIPTVYERGVELPHGLDAFMQLALAKDPEQRLQDAAAFANALAAALGDRRGG